MQIYYNCWLRFVSWLSLLSFQQAQVIFRSVFISCDFFFPQVLTIITAYLRFADESLWKTFGRLLYEVGLVSWNPLKSYKSSGCWMILKPRGPSIFILFNSSSTVQAGLLIKDFKGRNCSISAKVENLKCGLWFLDLATASQMIQDDTRFRKYAGIHKWIVTVLDWLWGKSNSRLFLLRV